MRNKAFTGLIGSVMNITGESCSVIRAVHMRIVSICIGALLASGCATVSMTASETVITSNITETQSALHAASNEFCDTAEERGWVAKATSIFGFANRLINGDSAKSKAEAERDYASMVGAEFEATDRVFQRIKTDAEAARLGLIEVTGTATGVLASDDSETGRSDVMSYERALVNAQKSHRAFSRAADLAAVRSGSVPTETEEALASLANEIDTARDTADTLAERYAQMTVSVSG